MVDDGRQAEIFLHGLDEDISTKVAMWKPTTMANTSNIAKQVKKKIDKGLQAHMQVQALSQGQPPHGNSRPVETFQVGGKKIRYRGAFLEQPGWPI